MCIANLNLKIMRKVILGSIASFAIVVAAVFNVNLNINNSNLSRVSLANVEALAQGEVVSGWYKIEIFSTRKDNGSVVSETEAVECREGGPTPSCVASCKIRFKMGSGWGSWQNC